MAKSEALSPYFCVRTQETTRNLIKFSRHIGRNRNFIFRMRNTIANCNQRSKFVQANYRRDDKHHYCKFRRRLMVKIIGKGKVFSEQAVEALRVARGCRRPHFQTFGS
jgi:hypothetical protein